MCDSFREQGQCESAGGDQTTQYVYGTTLSDSLIASSLLKRAEIYPDSVDGSDKIFFEYNRQGETTKITDQAGTVHEFDYDLLGRQTHDRITTLGSGVDGAVRRISSTYEVRGMREALTSYDNATVGSGSIVNDTKFTYNRLRSADDRLSVALGSRKHRQQSESPVCVCQRLGQHHPSDNRHLSKWPGRHVWGRRATKVEAVNTDFNEAGNPALSESQFITRRVMATFVARVMGMTAAIRWQVNNPEVGE